MKRISILLLLVFLITLFGSSLAQTPQYGGVLRRSLVNDPPTLDPAMITDTASDEVARQIFDGLVEYDPNGKVVPVIAKSWSISNDGLKYTFYLRDDVYFHNGRKVTAEDFVYSIKRVMDPKTASPRANFTDPIKDVVAKSKYILEITLKEPFAPFLSTLTYSCFWVVPKEEVEKLGKDFATKPVGTGAYIFDEWKHDVKIRVKANLKYFRGRPYTDAIEWAIIPDENVDFMNFEKGNLDITGVPDPEWDRVSNDPKYKPYILSKPILGIYYLGFNVKQKPFDNKYLRWAIARAIDKDSIVKVIRRNRAEVAYTILPPSMPGFSKDLYNWAKENFSYNVEEAKKLLEKAGYPGGKGLPEVVIYYNSSKAHQRIMEAIQANLLAIGINAKIQNYDWAVYLDLLDKGKLPVYRLGWVADYIDPDNFLWVLFNSANFGEGGNHSFYENPKVDELTNKARKVSSWNLRVKYYNEAERIILEDMPIVPIYYYVSQPIYQPWVHGLYVDPLTGLSGVRYRVVWLSKK
ncbi:MAG: peptide ABC transporter substrate-binding protein [Dictyoglomus sp. NZ13-RE01]|nr:MAG: peptide ABC transporter substrate-binding protein [Dictyoglomus sp. NZ13-RE01]